MHDHDPEPEVIVKGVYRHTKSGNLYEVLGVALQTETHDQLVIYRPLYKSNYELCARPFRMFIEEIELNGKTIRRFQKIS